MSDKALVRSRLAEITDLVPIQDAVAVIRVSLDAVKEIGKSYVDLAKVEAAREVALTKIQRNYDLYRQAFERIFDERRDAIEKHFLILEKGMQQDDRELILGALRGLGQIVAASPFADLKTLAQALESGETIEI